MMSQRPSASKCDASSHPVVAIFNVAMIGHVNPTFALVQELVKRGCRVHYFLPPVNQIREAAVQSGARVEAYLADDPTDFVLEQCGIEDQSGIQEEISPDEKALWERAVWPLASTLISGEYIIGRCREIGVQAVLYDPMTPHGLVVAKALGIFCASLVTYAGMGSLGDIMNSAAREGRIEKAAKFRMPYGKAIREKFGVDVQDQMLTRRQYYAKVNFITTCDDLVAPLPLPGEHAWADELRASFAFAAVGCMVSDDAPHVITARSCKVLLRSKSFGHMLPVAELEDRIAHGAKVVYAALGTMALSDRWSQDLGRASAGNLPIGTTGKQFCQHVWQALLEAFRQLGEGYYCVMCVGKQPDAMDFLGEDEDEVLSRLPPNVIVRTFVPQVEMLRQYANVFISHVGFNSLQESLIAGVPLIAVPQAVDQPVNARKVDASSWGRSFLKPMETINSVALAEAIEDLCDGSSRYRSAVARAKEQLQGGAARVADQVMKIVSRTGAKGGS